MKVLLIQFQRSTGRHCRSVQVDDVVGLELGNNSFEDVHVIGNLPEVFVYGLLCLEVEQQGGQAIHKYTHSFSSAVTLV